MQYAFQVPASGWRCPRQPAARGLSRRGLMVQATHCPYRTLGVGQNADEREIKQAYRRLALQYHPDVNHAVDAQRTFLSIQQAYELLTGRSKSTARGPNSANQANDWEFHDWYWAFTQKRRWRARQPASSSSTNASGSPHSEPTPTHKQPEHQSTLRTQLAGLRHRAAIRSTKHQREQQEQQQQQQQQPAWTAPDSPAAAPTAASAAAGATGHSYGDTAATTASSNGSAFAAAAPPPLEYDSSEMSDGVNIAVRCADPWSQPPVAKRPGFSSTDRHREQVMGQIAGLKRRSAIREEVW